METNNFDGLMIDFHKPFSEGPTLKHISKKSLTGSKLFTPNNDTEYLEVERKGRKLPRLHNKGNKVGRHRWLIKKMRSVELRIHP